MKSKKLEKLVILLALLVVSCVVFAESEGKGNSLYDFEIIDEIVKEEMERLSIKGVAIGIVDNDEIIYSKGYGVSDTNSTQITPDTKFIIGSVSKSFTAMAIMQLKEKGLLDLSDPIKKYLPWFQLKGESDSDDISISHLLTHTSGLSKHDGSSIQNGEVKDMEAFFREIKPVRRVGPFFEYSNLNFVLLGYIIEAVSGKNYDEYIKENIFIPLGMSNSYANIDQALSNGLTYGFQPVFGRLVKLKQNYYQYNVPAGYIVSSANDMAKYLTANMNNDVSANNRVISLDSRDNLLVTGMGWRIVGQGFGHAGSVAGYFANIFMAPAGRSGWVGLVVLVNTNDFMVPTFDKSYDLSSISKQISSILMYGSKPKMANETIRNEMYVLTNFLIIAFLFIIFFQIYKLKKFIKNIEARNTTSIFIILLNIVTPLLLYYGIVIISNGPFTTAMRLVPGAVHMAAVIIALFLLTALIQIWFFARVKILKTL